jgi:prepilin-type N-terminal cleavage/methylation domain-containing protein/prepilin-type processing-associated H-X9-DG protein
MAIGTNPSVTGERLDRGGFTLVELLVAIGIIVVLVGILVPSVHSVRQAAAVTTCASNMRQVGQALIGYAGANDGAFPPNSAQIRQYWYSRSVIGSQVTAPSPPDEPELWGGVLVCPRDRDDAVRSYSMNLYASSYVSKPVRARLDSQTPPGKLFKLGQAESSCLLLLAESWSELPLKTGDSRHVAQAIIGYVGRPGPRFGGGGGIQWGDPPDATKGRFDTRASQIAFNRHRKGWGNIAEVDPRGTANFCFLDGHVEAISQPELVTNEGKSSYRVLWSAIDREIELR